MIGDERRPFRFFAWVTALSCPLYAFAWVWPGSSLPFGLPDLALIVFLPALVATGCDAAERGAAAAFALWRRLLDVRALTIGPLLAATLTAPSAVLAAYALMRALEPASAERLGFVWVRLPLMLALLLPGAILEEIGWTGYATAPLQRRFGALGAGLVIGAVWAIWHLIPWSQGQGRPLPWVLGQAMATIALRVIMGRLYAEGGRSLILAVLFHSSVNLSYGLFADFGAGLDMRILAGVLAAIAAAVSLRPSARRLRSD